MQPQVRQWPARLVALGLIASLAGACTQLGQLSSPSFSPEPSPAATVGPTAPATPDRSPAPSASLGASPASPSPSPTTTALPGDLDLAEVAWFQSVGRADESGWDLLVGRLDGRTFVAVSASSQFEGAGPRDGKVLAWWREEDESVVALVDTGDGSSREVMRVAGAIDAAAFGVANDFYWVVTQDDGRVLGLWRASLDGGDPELIADGWEASLTFMVPSLDGGRIAVWTIGLDGVYSYRILDTERRELTRLRTEPQRRVAGFLGEDLIVWTEADTDFLVFPLIAIAPDGGQRVVADGDGGAAAIYRNAAGEPRLVYDGRDDDFNHTFSQLAPGDDGGTLIFFSVAEGVGDVERQIVYRHPHGAVEVTGWVPVFPLGTIFPLSDEEKRAPRTLVSLDGLPPVELSPQPTPRPTEDHTPRPTEGPSGG